MKIDIALSEASLDFSDVAIIMENTAHWTGRNATEITDVTVSKLLKAFWLMMSSRQRSQPTQII